MGSWLRGEQARYLAQQVGVMGTGPGAHLAAHDERAQIFLLRIRLISTCFSCYASSSYPGRSGITCSSCLTAPHPAFAFSCVPACALKAHTVPAHPSNAACRSSAHGPYRRVNSFRLHENSIPAVSPLTSWQCQQSSPIEPHPAAVLKQKQLVFHMLPHPLNCRNWYIAQHNGQFYL